MKNSDVEEAGLKLQQFVKPLFWYAKMVWKALYLRSGAMKGAKS